jgi:hypothetical protein
MRDINTWVYSGDGGIDDNWRKQNNQWTETNSDTYWDQLEVVPPKVMKRNSFVVGEPYDHIKGIPVYAVFVQMKNRYFGKNDLITNYNLEKYITEIKLQFGMEN